MIVQIPPIHIFSIFTPGEFIALCVFVGGMISQYIWVRVRLAELAIEVTGLMKRQDEVEKNRIIDNEKTNREAVLISRELAAAQIRLYDKLDGLHNIVTDIQIKCGNHDGYMQALKIKKG